MSSISPQYLWISLHNTLVSTLAIFDSNFLQAPHNLNSLRRLLNFVVLMAISGLVYHVIRHRKKLQLPTSLLLFMLALMDVVYIASGQASQKDTSRYLIMVPLVTLLLVSVWGGRYLSRYRQRLQMAWLGVTIVTSCLLGAALVVSLPHRYSKEGYTSQIQSFMSQNKFLYAVTARSLALPTNYYADRRLFILPVYCTPHHQLKKTYLFFDKAAYEKLHEYNGYVPVILQGSKIDQGAKCSELEIVQQLGVPQRKLIVPGVGEALVYKASSLPLEE